MKRGRGQIVRRVGDREQDFRVFPPFYPHGWITECLECGHTHREAILPERYAESHHHQMQRRRCLDCEAGAPSSPKRA
jgi:hypothetical protein